MFLFRKKTKNIIKYTWGVVSVIIILSMIITFSGFTSLAGTPRAPAPTPTSDPGILKIDTDQLDELKAEYAAQQAASSTQVPPTSPPQPVQKLKLDI